LEETVRTGPRACTCTNTCECERWVQDNSQRKDLPTNNCLSLMWTGLSVRGL